MIDFNEFNKIHKNCLTDGLFSELPNHESGKVRDSYNLPGRQRIMVSTDRQSAFDLILAAVPFKGQVLNQTSQFWFEETKDICPNHVLSFPDPNVIITQHLQMLPVEIVVRDYMTGSTETSIWPMYKKGLRNLYGHNFPENILKNQKLPKTIITPTTKALQGEHDTPITAEEIIKTNLLSKETWEEVTQKALALFTRGKKIASKNGLILVDTKYEFGLDQNGILTIADEIHTPDSSRFWIKKSYERCMETGKNPESLDKEFLRLWITSCCDPYKDQIPPIPQDTLIEFSKKYIQLYEQVTGQKFKAPNIDQPIRERIYTNLKFAYPLYFS